MSNNKTLCLVAIFKNESHILKEWLDHYINEGIEKFFLIDNGSSDDYLNILNPYIKKNIVDLVLDEKRYSQNELYNKHFLEKCKEYKWLLVCDLDEFVYARKEFSTITEYLNTLQEQVDQVLIPWKMFGSSGYNTLERKQPKNVVESFLTRRKCTDKIEVKTITRTNKLLEIHQHRCHLIDKKMDHNDFFINIDEKSLNELDLHLNHYAIQSFEWFMRVKVPRGEVFGPGLDHIRTEHYFRQYDINDIIDAELSMKHKMKKIDVIILSNTADETYHNLLSITVNSIKNQTDVESNIILVETNTEYKTKEQYNLPIDILVVPNEKFNFNRFLNHGLEYSTADYICFSNNDVRYFSNSLSNLIDGLQEYDSVCPFGIGYVCSLYKCLNLDTNSILEHCQINSSFLGWCYCFTRKTMNECFGEKFDEQFEFYRQDEDIVRTLMENKFRHAVVGAAKAEHLNIKGNHGRGSNSYKLLGTEEEQYFYTEHPRNWEKIKNKWQPIRDENGNVTWDLKKK